MKEFEQIIIGQQLDSPEAKAETFKILLKGKVAICCTAEESKSLLTTSEVFKNCVQAVTSMMLLDNALQMQHAYLCKVVCKPIHISICDYVTCSMS